MAAIYGGHLKLYMSELSKDHDLSSPTVRMCFGVGVPGGGVAFSREHEFKRVFSPTLVETCPACRTLGERMSAVIAAFRPRLQKMVTEKPTENDFHNEMYLLKSKLESLLNQEAREVPEMKPTPLGFFEAGIGGDWDDEIPADQGAQATT